NADQAKAKAKADDDSDMTKEEAFAILGLDNTATEEEIVMAHRRLIQKLHPDTGGNEYLATQLNLAKDVLINP
ncbi:MAG: DnaJ domain-containing protein, partial [Pseudomonadales bacterium]